MNPSETRHTRRQLNATSTPRLATAGLEQRLLKRLRDRHFGRNPVIVVGFSAGVDSLCLAAALARVSSSEVIRPRLVHVDHRLRPESGDDARNARVIAEQIRLPIDVVELLPGVVDRHSGLGIEEAARRERYAVLAECARASNTDLIAMAHHIDDQAETVLMHLFRGAGIEGAGGMDELSTLAVPWWSTESIEATRVRVWRPFLGESKRALREYVRALDLKPIEDGSNQSAEFRRNATRNELMPAIEAHFSGMREAIARFAKIASTENDFVNSISEAAYAGCRTRDGGIDLKPWLELHYAIRHRVVRIWLRDGIGTTEISMERVFAVTELAVSGRSGAVIEVAAGYCVWIAAEQLNIGTADYPRASRDHQRTDHTA
jgi:tRNA(Ile)-lysidine synthase